MSTHAAIVATGNPLGTVAEIQLPTLTPSQDEVLIKIEYATMMPFDGYQTFAGFFAFSWPIALGFSVSGTVTEVGPGVDDLALGDRVTAFTYIPPVGKATQQYITVSKYVVAKLPDGVPLDAAAAYTDNFVTAYHTLFSSPALSLALPNPASPEVVHTPVLIYGAGTSAGQYAIQLLHIAGYKKILTTSSPSHFTYLQSIGASHTFDYNSPKLISEIVESLEANPAGKGVPIIVVDPVGNDSSISVISKLVSPGSKVGVLLPIKKGEKVSGVKADEMTGEVPKDAYGEAEVVPISSFLYQENPILKETLLPKILPSLLSQNLLKPNRIRLFDTGSFKDRVETAVRLLNDNKISGEKVVIKVPHD